MLNENIKKLRCSFGLTQSELSKHLNVTKQCVSNWENNNILPSIDMLLKIADFFSVSCDYLLGTDNRKLIDVSGLSDEQVTHIRYIIKDILN